MLGRHPIYDRLYQEARAAVIARLMHFAEHDLQDRADRVWELITDVVTMGDEHPWVLNRMEVLMRREEAQHALRASGFSFAQALVDERNRTEAREADPGPPPTEAAFLAHIDAGADHGEWRPSALYHIGVAASLRPAAFRRWAMQMARQRWRDGFYANPFTAEPRRRAA